MLTPKEFSRGRDYPHKTFIHALDYPANQTLDFLVELSSNKKILYYTPKSWKAHDWCSRNLIGVPRHGQSYMFGVMNIRGRKLKSFLKAEEFIVNEDKVPYNLPRLPNPVVASPTRGKAK